MILKKTVWILSFLCLSSLANAQDYMLQEYLNKGKMSLQLGIFEEALDYFNRVLNINNQNEEAWFERGKTYWSMQEYLMAASDFNQVLSLNSKKAEAYLYLGTISYDQKDFQSALSYLNKAIELKNDYALAYNYRAEANKELGYYENSIQDYDQAINLKPELSLLYFGRGKCKSEVQDFSGAVADFTKAISLEPENDLYYFHRVNAQFLAKDYAATIQDIEKLEQLNPKAIESYHLGLLAFCKNKTEDYAGAIKALDELLILEKMPTTYLERAENYILLNETGKALQDLESALELDERNVSYAYKIAEINFAQSNYPITLAALEKVLQIDDQMADAWYMKGICELKQAQKKTAKISLMKAASLGYPAEKMTPDAYKLAKKGFPKR